MIKAKIMVDISAGSIKLVVNGIDTRDVPLSPRGFAYICDLVDQYVKLGPHLLLDNMLIDYYLIGRVKPIDKNELGLIIEAVFKPSRDY